ncbi:peptidoglycan-binding protein [Rhizobium binxianense]|uniref:peptidoglycan-binding protein n=1 Tax=Rhizobium binxianense TaxID=3024242 RepID=UPI00236238A7|nr:peptidoglycan-binding protein [Rhizobium sp. MJ37]MDC9835135.1 peptidoglycan-binding protein [Rhizobium sp. MJ37]
MASFVKPAAAFLSSIILLAAWSPRALSAESSANCTCGNPIEANSSSIVTFERITKFSPRARGDLALAIARLWKDPPPAELVNPIRVQHFMAQIATETGGFVVIEENLNYSAERLLKVFPTRVTPQQAQRLAHRPELIANHVYGGRLGNDQPGDGWRFRGSGFMQLTGRGNFEARGKLLNKPLGKTPELVRQPETGFETATAYWAARNINVQADLDNIKTVRKLVNGGSIGLPESKIWLARAKRIFVVGNQPTESAESEQQELNAVEEELINQGFLGSVGPQESSDPEAEKARIADALRNYQIENGLPATGAYDEPTLYTLSEPEPQDPLTPEELAMVQRKLQQMNLLSPSEASGPTDISEALKKFQGIQGLEVTGIYDEPTLQILLSDQDAPH